MNKFIKSFMDKNRGQYEHQERVIFISNQIKDVLGVSDELLKNMVRHAHSMDIKIHHGGGLFMANSVKVKLMAKSRCFADGWVDLIEVIPESNMETGWTIMGGGVGASILPSDAVMDKVMVEVEKIAKG